jgi:hypothetical protein
MNRNGDSDLILKQTHFSVKTATAITWIWCSATVSTTEQLPEDGQVEQKHVAIVVTLMLF